MGFFLLVFAIIGAGGVLFALTYVSILVGILVNGMIAIMAGPLIDKYFRRKGEQVYEPGSAR
jgi:hypothetical protein